MTDQLPTLPQRSSRRRRRAQAPARRRGRSWAALVLVGAGGALLASALDPLLGLGLKPIHMVAIGVALALLALLFVRRGQAALPQEPSEDLLQAPKPAAVAPPPSPPERPGDEPRPTSGTWGEVVGVLTVLAVIGLVVGAVLYLELQWYFDDAPYRYLGFCSLAGLGLLVVLGRTLAARRRQARPPVAERKPASRRRPAADEIAVTVRPPSPSRADRRPPPAPASVPAPSAGQERPPTPPAPVRQRDDSGPPGRPRVREAIGPPEPEQPPPPAPTPEPAPEAPAAEPKPRRMVFLGPGRTAVGLDVGTSHIKIVQVRGTRRGPVVTNFGMTPTPRHSIVEGVIVKPQDVAGAIRSLMSEIGLGHRRVVTAVGGQGVILRHAQFPRMSERELREVLRWEAEQHIPIPPGEAISDFSILEEVSPTDRDPKGAQKKMKVLLVATQQKVVNALLETLRVAGLYPVAVDVDAIAAYRVLTVNGYVPPSSRNLSTMLVDIGATTTKLSVFLDGVPQLTRTVPVAGNGLTAAVAEGLGQDMASAERSKREMGAMPDTPIARFLQPLLDELLLEVRRSIEFYLVRNYGQEINHIYLAGGGANLKGLPQALADYLNLSLAEHAEGEPDVCVQAVEPLREVELHPALNEQRVYLGPQFLVALGLALREEV